jgi:phage baseplate assembly protein W
MAVVKRVSKPFKDLSLSFDPHPVTKDLPVLTNERAIIRSVRNLVETIPTERFFNSILGSDVRNSLFEFVDYGTAGIIEDQIKTTIANFEPRVDNVVIEAIPQPDNNAFEVSIIFDIIGQQFPTQQFTFLLEATR